MSWRMCHRRLPTACDLTFPAVLMHTGILRFCQQRTDVELGLTLLLAAEAERLTLTLPATLTSK